MQAAERVKVATAKQICLEIHIINKFLTTIIVNYRLIRVAKIDYCYIFV